MKWGTISLVVARITRILSMVVLARLLSPQIFGIFAMANTAIHTIAVFREIGFGAAYIQRLDKDEVDSQIAVNTAFSLGLIIDFFVFSAIFCGAPLIANFFDTNELTNVLRVLAIIFLLEPVIGICNAILAKRLDFGKIALSEIAQVSVYASVAIIFAALGFEVWGLILAVVASKITTSILLVKLSGWRPGFQIKFVLVKEMFGFGKFMWAFAALSAVGGALDRVLIGKYWGAANLGYYHLAFNLCNLPASAFSQLINKITFPAFSKLQQDPDRIKSALLRIISNVSMLVMPASFGLVAVADEFIITIFGSQWVGTIPLIKILAFYGLTLSISAITGPVFKALGKPHVLFYTSINHHIILIVLLFLFRNQGVIGICYAVLIPLVVSSLIAIVLIERYLKIKLYDLLSAISMPLVLSFLMYGIVRGTKYLIETKITHEPQMVFMFGATVGSLSYILLSFLLNKDMLNQFKLTAIEIIKSKNMPSP